MKSEVWLDAKVLVNITKLLRDMEDTTWNHSGDREAANVGYKVTDETTFQGAKEELAQLLRVAR